MKKVIMDYPKPFTLIKYKYSDKPSHVFVRTIKAEESLTKLMGDPLVTEIDSEAMRDVEATIVRKYIGVSSGTKIVEDCYV